MQRGRLIIIIALVLIVLGGGGAVAAFVLLQPQPGSATPTPAGGVVEVTATPEPVMNVIAASQNIERGFVIPTEAVIAIPWPTTIAPPTIITDVNQVVGTRARYSIQRGEPILSTMLIQSLSQLSPFGSDAAGQIPAGSVALSIPYDPRHGVALGIRDGDSVNVLVTWALVDIDEEFQSMLPNLVALLSTTVDATGAKTVQVNAADPFAQGRGETDNTIDIKVYALASEPQRPRIVSQAIIQNARVLKMGQFLGADRPTVIIPTPTPNPDPNATQPPPPPPPPPTPYPDIVSLIVSPQDALVLNFITRLQERYPDAVKITLVLRSAGDTTVVDTESVTLQYMFETYRISLPAKLDYGLAPSATSTPIPTATAAP